MASDIGSRAAGPGKSGHRRRLGFRGADTVKTTPADDEAIDSAASRAFAEEFGDQASSLPPVAVVIAAYNEEGAIGPVVAGIPATIAGVAAATIVVSDGAMDATAKEAKQAGALVCEVPVNRGQGAALRLGYRLARDGGARYIVTTDGDGQYNPAEIEGLLAPILSGQADFVTGSRARGSEETRDPVRKLGVRVFALMISALTGQRITDTTFGLRAMRAEVTGVVRLEQPQYQASELLIGVITHGYRVAELPATIHRRRVGKSKKGNNAFYALSFVTVVIGTWLRERKRRAREDRGVLASAPEGVTANGSVAGTAASESAGAPERGGLAFRDVPAPGDPRSAKST
jgi:glycosyltransferase involved in cell wall biosynthesis